MPYTIDYSQSSKTAIVVNDGTIDTSTSIGLIGKKIAEKSARDSQQQKVLWEFRLQKKHVGLLLWSF